MGLKVNIEKNFDDFRLALNFTIGNELVVLFGPSGAGKSITLKIIAGLTTADQGEIILGNTKLFCSTTQINLSPQRRFTGLIYQNHALFPHFTILENIIYGANGYPKSERHSMAKEWAAKFKLENIAHKYPNQISGGQQQKALLARAIIRKPNILLLDEPFSALDAPTKIDMCQNLQNIQSKLNIPIIVVTHDLAEAQTLTKNILPIKDGKI